MDPSEAVVDDDFDVYNDETFGDDGGEFSWPEENDPLDQYGEAMNLMREKSEERRDTFQNNGNGFTSIRNEKFGSNQNEDNDFEIENEMEESISRLVLDDESEIGSITKAKRLATSHACFMPPQVVNKNLSWFMEKDLPGGSSLLGSSVWSMHPTAVAPPRPVDNDPFWSGEGPISSSSNLAPVQNRPPPGLLRGTPPARTVDEIEREQFQASNVVSMPPTRTVATTGSRAITVRELELDMSEEALRHGSGQRNQSTGFSSPATVVPLSNSPRHGHINLRHAGSPGSNQEFFHRPPPGLVQNPAMMQRPNQFNQARYPYPPPGSMFPPPHPGIRMRGMHQMHQRPRMYNSGAQFMIDGHHPHGNNNQHVHYGQMQYPVTDPFAGLMTERDKQRLRNIQIIQLQNDHPYKTDYYHQMRLYKKTNNLDCLKRLFPSKDDTHIKNFYEPAKFENALGKLQAVSALAPKRIIDSNIGVNSGNKSHGPSHRPQLLCEIERIYTLYLDLKEVYCRTKAQTIGLYAERQKAERMYTKLLDLIVKHDTRLIDWMTVPKGRALMFEFVAFLRSYEMHQNEAFMLLGTLLQRLPASTMIKLKDNNEDWRLFLAIEEMLKTCATNQVDILLQALPKHFFESRLGCTIYFSILQTAAFSCIEDERTEFFVCKHSWRPDMAGHMQEGYIPPNHLVGFQRIPALISELVEAANEKVAPLLRGRSRLSLKVLLEFMKTSSVKNARQRLHSLHTYLKFGHICDPKNKYIDEFSEGKAEYVDPIIDLHVQRRVD